MSQRLAILVVTFNPSISELIKNLNSYKDQCEKIFIIDNSDNLNLQELVKQLNLQFDNLHIHQFFENLGIAAAQNKGISLISSFGYDYLIEMDQDSSLPENYVNNLVNSYNKLKIEGSTQIAGIGPLAINIRSGDIYEGYKRNVGIFKVEHTLSSGLLVNLETFKKVGLKNEELFIDMVDWDWCWRASKLGFYTYIDSSIGLFHSMGNKHITILGFKIGVPTPLRHYYAFRNTLLLIKRDYPSTKWKFKSLFLLIGKAVFYPIILDQGLLRLKYMIYGLSDFLTNKTGKYNGN